LSALAKGELELEDRPWPVILDLAESRKGLLRIRQISTAEGIGQFV
jgi:hypothetical protein